MNYYIFDKEIKNNTNINNSNAQQNNNQFKQNQDFLYPKISNQSKPLNKSHENYIFDRNAELFFNQNKGNYMNPVNTRALDSKKQSPVQQSFQNDFYMSNYETINFGQEKNMYLDLLNTKEINDEIEFITKKNDVFFIKREKIFCNFYEKRCPSITEEGYKLYWDYSHITDKGAEFFARIIEKDEFFLKYLNSSLNISSY